jgi:serine/threonine-protein kinase
VDSLIRDIARAPGLTPPGSTLESSGFAPAALVPGLLVGGRFRLERMLGEGGMGVVWAATHAVTRKPVALKFLKRSRNDDSRAVQRFLREARAACAVRHPSVVEVHDVLELEDGSPVMVMDLLSGETLAQRLARDKLMPLPELVRIMVHVCSAVGCAHALGIVHRDLKPENIFLAQSSGGRAVKVLDFGIAKLTASEGDAAQTGAITGTGAILGTPYYMAPEQLFGERDIDHRADIWALGIIFYEALTGERPTRGDNVGQIYKVIMTDAIVPFGKRAGHLPRPFVELVERMLSRDRAKRPADMSAVLSVLADYTDETFALVTGPPVAPSTTDPGAPPVDVARAATSNGGAQPNRSGIEVPPRSSTLTRSRAPLWATLAVLTVGAIGAGAVATSRPHAPQAPEAPAVSALTSAASIPVPVPPSPATPTAPPSATPSVVQGEAVAPSAVTPALRAGKHPRPAGSTAKAPAPSTSPSAASASTPVRPGPAPSVDPGSYQ